MRIKENSEISEEENSTNGSHYDDDINISYLSVSATEGAASDDFEFKITNSKYNMSSKDSDSDVAYDDLEDNDFVSTSECSDIRKNCQWQRKSLKMHSFSKQNNISVSDNAEMKLYNFFDEPDNAKNNCSVERTNHDAGKNKNNIISSNEESNFNEKEEMKSNINDNSLLDNIYTKLFEMDAALISRMNTEKCNIGYKCYKCGKKITGKHNLESHLSTHLLIKPYSCFFCNFETASSFSFRFHKNTHPEYKLPLKKCGFASGRDLTSLHNLNPSISNDETEVQTSFSKNFSTVLKSNVPVDNNSFIGSASDSKTCLELLEPITCYFCSYSASTTRELNNHYSKKHPPTGLRLIKMAKTTTDQQGNTIFFCPKCPSVTTNFRGFFAHFQVHSKNRKSFDKSLPTYNCDMCPFRTLSHLSLQSHYKCTHKIYKKNIKIKIL